MSPPGILANVHVHKTTCDFCNINFFIDENAGLGRNVWIPLRQQCPKQLHVWQMDFHIRPLPLRLSMCMIIIAGDKAMTLYPTAGTGATKACLMYRKDRKGHTNLKGVPYISQV